MPPSSNKITKIIAWVMFIDLMALGLFILLSAYAPSRMTRFGMVEALVGPQAQWFGGVIMLLSGLPLLLLAPNKSSVIRWGTVLGMALLLVIFLPILL